MKVVVIGPGPRTRGGIATVNAVVCRSPGAVPLPSVNAAHAARHAGTLAALAALPLRLRGAEAVHVHLSRGGSFWRKLPFLEVATAAGVPRVLHVHPTDFWSWAAALPPRRRSLVRRHVAGAAAVITLSSEAAAACAAFGGRAAVVLPNPLPAAQSAPAGVARDLKRFLFLGALLPEKGIAELIAACALLAAEGRDFTLDVAGDQRPAWLHELVAARGLGGRVRYLGWIAGAEKERALASALALVLPSYREGMPMVLLEATVCGTPCIVTPVGAVPELFAGGESALFVEPRSAASLAAAMRRALERPAELLAMPARALRGGGAWLTEAAYLERLHGVWRAAAGARGRGA